MATSPVIIFGTGGSGTRFVAEMTRHLGYDLGSDVNRSLDSIRIREYLEQHGDAYIRAVPWMATIHDGQHEVGRSQATNHYRHLERAVTEHRATTTSALWGWKNPRSILVLPLLVDLFPNAVFIHVVRDGRDMALSRNQNQVMKHGHLVDPTGELTPLHRSAAYWSWTNTAAHKYLQTSGRASSLLVRYEDACSQPGKTLDKMMDLLESNNNPDPISPQAISIGRWRQQPTPVQDQLRYWAREGLETFEYV